MARHLDGRVTAVFGTHTHIQTNDARVQPGGTAAITDAGMTGPHDSVIGVKADQAIKRMLTGMPVRFETAEGDVRIEGVLFECDGSGRATSCETFRLSVDVAPRPARRTARPARGRGRARARTRALRTGARAPSSGTGTRAA